MTASSNDIKRWLENGKERGATHVIIARDTWDHDNYPVYVMPGTDVKEKITEYKGKDMQTIDEVYNLSMDIKKQLKAWRVWND